MSRELPKVYEPQQVENRIYQMWENNGYFRPAKKEGAKPFTIVMPPPNVTGQLHMGHAMDATLQDTLIRFKRMQGYNTLKSSLKRFGIGSISTVTVLLNSRRSWAPLVIGSVLALQWMKVAPMLFVRFLSPCMKRI